MYLNGQTYAVALYANPQAVNGYTVNSINYSTASVGLIAGGNSAPLVLGTQGTEKIRIYLTGDVSIGLQANNITGSGYKLNITGSGASGSLNVNDVLRVSGSSVAITGSASITDVLVLSFRNPLPSSKPTGSVALSGSGGTFEGMYVYNGTSWTKVGP
jgi:hypothetical protein